LDFIAKTGADIDVGENAVIGIVTQTLGQTTDAIGIPLNPKGVIANSNSTDIGRTSGDVPKIPWIEKFASNQ
jgi:hypothetical protein